MLEISLLAGFRDRLCAFFRMEFWSERMPIRGCQRLAASLLVAAIVLNPLKSNAAQTGGQVHEQPQAQTQSGTQPQTPPAAQTAAPPKHAVPSCISVADMTAMAPANSSPANKDVCVTAHVYDVVELANGTRFLDVCPTDVADEDCRFILMSLRDDRNDVGDLRRYRGQDISVRGTMRPMRGRMGIVISHVRQFSGGPEKFKPNPRLLRDFNGQSDRMPVRDPNLTSSGHHRSFMNTQDREKLPANTKP
jgi:hypothetical protein